MNESSRSIRAWLVLAVCAALAATVGLATATAGNGGNSQKKLCLKGGWQTVYRSDGTSFTTQRECVSYVADGGTLTTTRPPQGSQIDCELFGGTYSTDPASDMFPGSDHKVIWTCNGWSVSDFAQFVERTDTLNADCLADDPAAVFWGEGTNHLMNADCAERLVQV